MTGGNRSIAELAPIPTNANRAHYEMIARNSQTGTEDERNQKILLSEVGVKRIVQYDGTNTAADSANIQAILDDAVANTSPITLVLRGEVLVNTVIQIRQSTSIVGHDDGVIIYSRVPEGSHALLAYQTITQTNGGIPTGSVALNGNPTLESGQSTIPSLQLSGGPACNQGDWVTIHGGADPRSSANSNPGVDGQPFRVLSDDGTTIKLGGVFRSTIVATPSGVTYGRRTPLGLSVRFENLEFDCDPSGNGNHAMQIVDGIHCVIDSCRVNAGRLARIMTSHESMIINCTAESLNQPAINVMSCCGTVTVAENELTSNSNAFDVTASIDASERWAANTSYGPGSGNASRVSHPRLSDDVLFNWSTSVLIPGQATWDQTYENQWTPEPVVGWGHSDHVVFRNNVCRGTSPTQNASLIRTHGSGGVRILDNYVSVRLDGNDVGSGGSAQLEAILTVSPYTEIRGNLVFHHVTPGSRQAGAFALFSGVATLIENNIIYSNVNGIGIGKIGSGPLIEGYRVANNTCISTDNSLFCYGITNFQGTAIKSSIIGNTIINYFRGLREEDQTTAQNIWANNTGQDIVQMLEANISPFGNGRYPWFVNNHEVGTVKDGELRASDASQAVEVDNVATNNLTRMFLYVVDASGTGAMQRVSRGADDSAGAGFAWLRVPN